MATLVIFYSLDGNTRLISRDIAAELGAEMVELLPVRGYSKGFSRYLVGGMQAMLQRRPPLQVFQPTPEGYDSLVIGTPVWAGRMAAPMLTFLSAQGLVGKDIGLFCTHRGNPGGTLAGMERMLMGNRIAGKLDLLMGGNNREGRKKARIWARSYSSSKETIGVFTT